ncbi:Protease secretion protein [Ketogulonicigenium robustum]|uniref:Protease secretion protein n=1 Tax=Ketogulonicigenium robustum TaxID=92947 RepID=A0A1W6NWN7_9RHOB|nr:HlyD family efflux transporter periplasmic adaptor subunit [Ketogulonicigenium robustum]ARO13678.1 Protease secretion protein [Ketogulonicigenium robustum]
MSTLSLRQLQTRLWHLIAITTVALVGLMGSIPVPSATIAHGTIGGALRPIPLGTSEMGVVAAVLTQTDARVAAGEALVNLSDTALRAQLAALDAEETLLLTRLTPGAALVPIISAEAEAHLATLAADSAGLAARLSILATRLPLAQATADAQSQLAATGRAPAPAARAATEAVAALRSEQAALQAAYDAIPLQREVILQRRSLRQAEVAENTAAQRASTQARLIAVRAERAALTQRLSQTRIIAPAAGRLITLDATVGQVVRPGDTVAMLLPDSPTNQAVVPVPPAQASQISVGQAARLVPAGFQRGEITGHVSAISADTLSDANGAAYYRVTVTLPDDSGLRAGHPVDAYFTGPSRVILGYLLQPLTAALRATLREPALPHIAAAPQSD